MPSLCCNKESHYCGSTPPATNATTNAYGAWCKGCIDMQRSSTSTGVACIHSLCPHSPQLLLVC
jgi:hypothetical protein